MTAGRFYALWGVAVLLALVLPVAVPYALWPTAYFDDASSSRDCASIARNYVVDHPATKLWPLRVEVARCEGTLAEAASQMRARVEARGPYGIPFASGSVDGADIQHLSVHGGAATGLAALLGGAFVVSMPFALVSMRRLTV